MKIVLDTNIYSDLAEGVEETVNCLANRSGDLFMPSIVIGELQYGFQNGSRQEKNERKLLEFISELNVRIIDANFDVARKYGLIYLSLRQKGRKIPLNDVWIAACCMDVGGTLLTRDKHFSSVDQIEKIILSSLQG